MRRPIKDICVVGIGNPSRQDDGAGVAVARELRQRRLADVVVMECQKEATGLISRWEDFRAVILIDAVSSDKRPGTVHRFEVPGDTLPQSIFCASTHTFNIADCIELARTLDQLPSRMVVYGIEGRAFEIGEGLSPQVETAAHQMVDTIQEEIRALRAAEQATDIS